MPDFRRWLTGLQRIRHDGFTALNRLRPDCFAARLAFGPVAGSYTQCVCKQFDGSKAIQTYLLSASASWEIDGFGTLMNGAKGQSLSAVWTDAYRQAAQTQVIANIANSYYLAGCLTSSPKPQERRQLPPGGEQVRVEGVEELGAWPTKLPWSKVRLYYQVQALLPEIHPSIRERKMPFHCCGQTPAIGIGPCYAEEQEMPDTFRRVPFAAVIEPPGCKAGRNGFGQRLLCNQPGPFCLYPKITFWSGSAGGPTVGGSDRKSGQVPGFWLGRFRLHNRCFPSGAVLKYPKAQQEEARLAFWTQHPWNAERRWANALSGKYKAAGIKAYTARDADPIVA